ncbi:MAG: CxxxxCH/CxxCH domain c-type cytochrome [Thermodesulfovibrionales bacterium]
MLLRYIKKYTLICATGALLLLAGVATAANNPPHDASNGIGCNNCHLTFSQEAASPVWTFTPDPLNPDNNQINNRICWQCHVDSDLGLRKTHSKYTSDTDAYGIWSWTCVTCHDPHQQKQVNNLASVPVLKGTVTAVAGQVFTISLTLPDRTGDANPVNDYVNWTIVPHSPYKTINYKITANTATTVTVAGTVQTTRVFPGTSQFVIIPGRYVRDIIATPGGNKIVRFLQMEGPYSFVHNDGLAAGGNDSTPDGVCQVCHAIRPDGAFMSYAKADGTGIAGHGTATSVNCATCHSHSSLGLGMGNSGCTGCHGATGNGAPIVAGELVGVQIAGNTTGHTVGAHPTHVVTKNYDCAICHNNNAMPALDNVITVAFSGAAAGGAYQGKALNAPFSYNAGVTVGATETCSTIYCHSSGQSADGTTTTPYVAATPNWEVPASGACDTCHPTTAMATGNHTGHLSVDTNCGLCHTGATAAAYNSINHVNQSIDVANNYTAGGAPGNGYGTCSTASCHADVYSAGTAVTPAWGSAGNGCSACHSVAIDATGPATGSHVAHNITDCSQCHTGATDNATKPVANHIDGDIDAANGYPVTAKHAAGSYTGTCSTASCHSDPYSAGTAVTPVWGTAAGCSACHNANPITVNGPATGSHTTVTGHAVACITCHNAGTTDTTSPSTEHADGLIDTAASVGYTDEKAKGSAYTTCSTASCHANPYGAGTITSPTWGSTGNGCAACHTGANVITANGPATGSHTTVAGHAVACTTCHNAGTTDTTSPSTEHADTLIDTVASVGYTDEKAKGSAYTTCSTASCHANPYGAGTITSPTWGSTAGCAACHTGANVITANGPATGSHTTVAGHAVACTTCHNAGTSSTTSPSTEHADTLIDTVASVGYTDEKAKGSAYTTCSTASCHANPYGAGTITSPTWGSTAGCAACHTGANVITANGPATGSHTTVAGHAVACTTCHNAGTSSTTSPSTEHADTLIDTVASVGYTDEKAKGSAYTTCSTASCHANPYGAGTITSPTWGSTGNGCAACHTGANVITANGPATGSHTTVAGHAVACTTCHNAGTTDTTSPSTEHADTLIDTVASVGYTDEKAKGSAFTTCSTASCHANPYGAGTVTTPVWGATAGCAACHTGANVITANGPATGSHTTVAGHAVACTTCHNAGTSSSTAPSTEHRDTLIDTVAAIGYTDEKAKGSAFATCSTASCHANPYGAGTVTTPTWGATAGCAACHTGANVITANGPATGSHTTVAGHAVACTTCHNAGTSSTTSPSTEHNDTLIDTVASVGYTDEKAKGSAATTCSTASCHANPYGAGTITTPTWGSTGNGCAACHTGANVITANGPATGSHAVHMGLAAAACVQCHNAGTTATTSPSTEHIDTLIDTANAGYTDEKAKGSAFVSCSTNNCHGATSPVWGTDLSASSTCVKCHGVAGTSPAAYTADTKTAAPGYNGTGLNTADSNGAPLVGGVSADSKVGAHDTHLRGNGGYKTGGIACSDCHAVTALGDAGHMNGSTTMTWSNLAKNIGTTPYFTDKGAIVPGYTAPNCSANYCHGGGFSASVVGNNPSPSWVSGAYLVNAAVTKDGTDCNQCHLSPPTASAKFAHGSMTIATNCASCHNHNGGADARHINGILEASGGACNSCHDYDTTAGGTAWGIVGSGTGLTNTSAAWGGHAKHIEHFKARSATTLNASTDTYGSVAFNNVCGVCHSQNEAVDHGPSGGLTTRNINFNGSTTHRFGATGPTFDSGAARSCSSVDCHFKPTPQWGL